MEGWSRRKPVVWFRCGSWHRCLHAPHRLGGLSQIGAQMLDKLRNRSPFIAFLSAKFLDSKWAAQESVFIVSRPEVDIAPLSIDGTVPFGFFGHVQSSRIPKKGITRDLLVVPFARRHPREISSHLIQVAVDAAHFETRKRWWTPTRLPLQSSGPRKRIHWRRCLLRMVRSGMLLTVSEGTCRNSFDHKDLECI